MELLFSRYFKYKKNHSKYNVNGLFSELYLNNGSQAVAMETTYPGKPCQLIQTNRGFLTLYLVTSRIEIS